ncbi:transposase [Kitasatospora sp. NBC_00240]|uniref:transposase n=1 Tax=Kitasatospora sp. NBC_00240 TaxID=2903567 RepID=UPI002250B462|nr:transposase [Kitasatospora sp. NBC_00240]MCX5215546.1 transposase [Kitasatospora sp. NBC_00240]
MQQLRDLTRTRTAFTQDRALHKHRVEKLFEDAQIKLSTVVSDLFGVSRRAMLNTLVAGERNPRVLADLARDSLVKKREALIEALTGQFEDHHGHLLRILLDTVDHFSEKITELDRRITAFVGEMTGPPSGDDNGDGKTPASAGRAGRELIDCLDAIPSVGAATVQIILAEIGHDMSRFPSPEYLASWAKLCPGPSSPGRRTPPVPPDAATPGSRAPGRGGQRGRLQGHLPR